LALPHFQAMASSARRFHRMTIILVSLPAAWKQAWAEKDYEPPGLAASATPPAVGR
jgi:hypothetical protein